MPASGRLITIEGIDGSGKTTLAQRLHAVLAARGVDAVLLREPGGVELSERIRELVRNPGLRIGARAEALLYAAARAQLVDDAIRPRLEHGGWILLDRFVESSLAYQGGGRELGIDAIARLNLFATGNLIPDRTLLLEIDTDAARAREGGPGARGRPVLSPDRRRLPGARRARTGADPDARRHTGA
jgi:dTMP kinase